MARMEACLRHSYKGREPLTSFDTDVTATRHVLDMHSARSILVGHSYELNRVRRRWLPPRPPTSIQMNLGILANFTPLIEARG